jgi:hypothetical protein
MNQVLIKICIVGCTSGISTELCHYPISVLAILWFQGLKLCIQGQRRNLFVIIWLLALHTSCVCHASVLEVVVIVQTLALWLQKLFVLQNAHHLACMANHVQLPLLSNGVSYEVPPTRYACKVFLQNGFLSPEVPSCMNFPVKAPIHNVSFPWHMKNIF